MAFIGKMMLPVVKPKWIDFGSYQGELVAIVAQLPDINEALRGLDGRLFPIGLPKLLWRLHVRGTRRARVVLAATAKKWRDTFVGVAALAQLMAKSLRDARAAGVEEVEYSWILETNQAAIAPVVRLPARRTRVFRIYEKELASNASGRRAQGLGGEERGSEPLRGERPPEPQEAASTAILTADAHRADIARALKEALVRRTGRRADDWSEETRLKDAGVDSLDALECLFELEERYKIDIDFNINDSGSKLVTVGDFVDLASRAVNAKRRP
jgi:acyl carrier protein